MKTILYVEDHPPAQMLMQAIISELTAYRLVLAASGAEADQKATAETPDLYILDLDLPDTDGMALAQAVYQRHPAPVILVSAYAEAVRRETLPAMIVDYLAKPLDPDHVAAIIQRTLS
jgi:two-component system OmpR family response regulator/two-component system alkaline phosphatase synthesis response regulator PhoP